MKTIKSISMFALAAFLLIGCKQTSNQQEETKVETDTVTVNQTTSTEITGTMQKATFQVEGMACAVGCAKVIEGKLAKLEGVQNAKVDFETKTATLEFDDAKQNTESIKKMVEEIANGAYKVENMNVSKELAMLDQDDKSTQKKCCSSHKDGKSCDTKDKKDKKGCCKKDGNDKKSTTNII